MEDAAGNLRIVESKGGTSRLAEGQMGREWVEDNIKRLQLSASWNPWGQRLKDAFDDGKLRGIALQSTDWPLGSTVELGRWNY
jgi:hypothetical protein